MDTVNETAEIGSDGKEWLHTFDATAWAREFIKISRQKPEIVTDEGCMIGWFANAIMCGYDEANRRNAKKPE